MRGKIKCHKEISEWFGVKALAVFYSRTGTTRKVAESISKALSCDIEEIFDTKSRAGPLGFITAGRDASEKKLTVIQESKMDPSVYDIVVIGTPVWAGTMSAAIRTYVSQNRERFKRVAFFCTCGGMDADRTLEAMKDLCGKETVASLTITKKETEGEEYSEKIREFVTRIEGTTS
jgi:flavodoxin